MAWRCISPEVIVKGFKKCCISNAVDEVDDTLWSGVTEGGNVSECEGDEGTDWEGGDSEGDWQLQVQSDMLCVFSV
jgi:hypothetical protein